MENAVLDESSTGTVGLAEGTAGPAGLAETHASSLLEKVLEHRFISGLATVLWLQGVSDFEVLKSEVDAGGYDLVVEARGIIRHIQLKAMRQGGRRRDVDLSLRLTQKPSGCVVWMTYDPESLRLGPFLWLGSGPGEPLEALGDKVARHTKGDATGHKANRPMHRTVPRSAFRKIEHMETLARTLFGQPPAAVEPAERVPDMSSPRGDGGRPAHPGDPVRLELPVRSALEALVEALAPVAGREPDPEELCTIELPQESDRGLPGLPVFRYGEPVEAFWRVMARADLLHPPFDWGSWIVAVREAGSDPLDPAFIAGLSADDLRRALTALQRAERFTDGTWREALQRGTFRALILRALELDAG